MAIRSGRDGSIKWDPAGGAVSAADAVVSLRQWKLSMKTDKINVTTFGDQNKKYVPGLKDISGSVSGFWDSTDTTLFEAADGDTPGTLVLIPNTNEGVGSPLVPLAFSGLAYMDADIDTNVEGAPAVTGSFVAAGNWTIPT